MTTEPIQVTAEDRRWRKKPVVIEAMRFTGVNEARMAEIAAFMGYEPEVRNVDDVLHLVIPTLEGDHLARPGDWIIKGVAGEFYPCKPEIFEKTYERATEARLSTLSATTPAGDAGREVERLIADVPPTWRKDGYANEVEEIADMANVGRALMEALPDGYSYSSCPSEIVCDLINERDDALAALRQPEAESSDEEYMSVTLSRGGRVTSHNAFDADFDQMVVATETIIRELQRRLSNRKYCPYSHGAVRKHQEAESSTTAAAVAPVAWRTEYRDVYRGTDTGWHYVYHDNEPHPAPLSNGCGHRNKTPLYALPPSTEASSTPAQPDVSKLREALERITNARMAIDGGSIEECRRIARKALNASGESA